VGPAETSFVGPNGSPHNNRGRSRLLTFSYDEPVLIQIVGLWMRTETRDGCDARQGGQMKIVAFMFTGALLRIKCCRQDKDKKNDKISTFTPTWIRMSVPG
jgi:hypothetical protein